MLFVLQLGSCSGSDIPQGGRRGGNCGGTCAHGGHDVGFVLQQAACNDGHLCAGADLGDDPGHDAGKDLDKIRLALLQLTGQAGQREGIQNECPLDGQQAAVARPAWASSATTAAAPAWARWRAVLMPSTPAPTAAKRARIHPTVAEFACSGHRRAVLTSRSARSASA